MNTVEPSSAQASGSRAQSAADNASAAESPSLESLVARVADEFLQRQRDGEEPDVEEYAARHPEAAGVLREVLAALCLVRLSSAAGGSSAGAEDPLGGCLGDFRIVREVGRGGMGVVYEAEQISLRRRVALKMLPFAGALDAKLLQRFRNEALAAASLHHEHIIPVHAVGCERGIHFYAMQFVEGCTLAQLIKALRREDDEPPSDPAHTTDYRPGGDSPTPLLAALSTERSGPRGRPYYRHAAELMTDAAQALDYAHQMGVVHRDVKPGNLMMDTRGTLWVTDFGLAHLQQGEASLTMTGDLVGTLRYMSPEQALAKRVPIDHRCDVYSLGVTLYELLTLRPAFTGVDRQELLRQIAFEEPLAPRKIERNIPSELETIALKAMEKNAADRYGTAQELADDLRRFLEDKPIRARRPPLWLRLRKWGRRHKPVVAGLAAGLLTLLVVGVVLGVGHLRRLNETERGVTAAVSQVETLLDEGEKQIDHPERWLATARLARSALEKAEELLATGAATGTLSRRVEKVRPEVEAAVADSSLLVAVERIRLEQALVKEGIYDNARGRPLYAQVMGDYGVDLGAPERTAALLRDSRIREALLAALDDWLRVTGDKGERRKLELILQAAQPPDAFRMRWAKAAQRKDVVEMVKLAAELPTPHLPAMTVCGMAKDLTLVNEWATAERLLRAAQERKPGDFWLNHDLGWSILHRTRTRATQPSGARVSMPSRIEDFQQGRTGVEEAVGYLRVALALRSDSPGVHLNLGHALTAKGDIEGAIRCNEAALRIDPNYAEARCNLGYDLYLQKKVDEAIASYRKAIGLKPDLLQAHINLGVALGDKGNLDEAIAEFREALRLDKDIPEAHHDLANALARMGKVDEAIDEYREIVRLWPDIVEPRIKLGAALQATGKVDEAIAVYREAIGLRKDYAEAHYNLGTAFVQMRKLDDAIAQFRKAIGLKKDYPEAHNNLGNVLAQGGKLDESIAEFRTAIDLNKDYPLPHIGLGGVLAKKGKLDESIAELQKAIDLLDNAVAEQGKLDKNTDAFQRANDLKRNLPGAHFNLGMTLMDKGKLDDAVTEFRKAIDLKKDNSEVYNELGLALKRKGKLDEAIVAFQESIRLKKDSAQAHCNLGNALVEKGHFKQAVPSLRLGHQLGSRSPGWPYPSAEWLRETELMAQLDDRLSSVLEGKDKPKDASERLGFASLCQEHRQRFAAAARFFEEAFTEQPALAANLRVGHRYNAACAAALAGCGHGKDATALTKKERTRLRTQALDWLRADLDAWNGLMKKGPDKIRAVLIKKMQRWQEDTDFAGVRGPQAIAKLPEAERPAWQKLWSDVTDTVTCAQEKSTPTRKPVKK